MMQRNSNSRTLMSPVVLLREDLRAQRLLPVAQVPIKDRCGSLRVIVATQAVVHGYVEGCSAYGDNVSIEPAATYESCVEVLPRNYTPAVYEQWAAQASDSFAGGHSRLWRTPHTPMVVTCEPVLRPATPGRRLGANYVAIISFDGFKLRLALQNELPYIGVAQQDITSVVGFIMRQLSDGAARQAA